jgi:hypothetical protein
MNTARKTDSFAPMTSDTVTIDGFTYTIARETDATRYVVSEYLIAGNPSHRHRGSTPALRSFTMFVDGSGCSASIEVYGRVIVCDYKRGEFQANDLPPKRDYTPRWKIEGAIKLARAAFIERFNATAPDGWRELHATLYA